MPAETAWKNLKSLATAVIGHNMDADNEKLIVVFPSESRMFKSIVMFFKRWEDHLVTK